MNRLLDLIEDIVEFNLKLFHLLLFSFCAFASWVALGYVLWLWLW